MSETNIPEATLEQINDLERMIHEPARMLIIAYLSLVESASFLYLLQQTGLTKGNLSSHLTKLEDVGYIRIDKEFVDKKPQTICQLTDNGREAFHSYLQNVRQVVDSLI